MTRWRSLLACLGALCLALAAFAAPMVLDDERFDVNLDALPAASLAPTSALTIALDTPGTDARVSITATKITIIAGVTGTGKMLGEAPIDVVKGKPLALSVLRRAEWLGVAHGTALLLRVPTPGNPTEGTSTVDVKADKGWTITEQRAQGLETVAFSDNFMRTEQEAIGWTLVKGAWKLQSAWDRDPKGGSMAFKNANFALNPFAWTVRPAGQPALCTTGQPFWEDYTATVAVTAAVGGTVGMAVNVSDPAHYLLVNWTPISDTGPRGNALTLLQVADGKETVLATAPGGCLPNQWYRLSVVSAPDGVRVLVDGEERLSAKTAAPWRGGVGLYAAGTGAVTFDDVTVYGRGLRTDLLAEHRLASYNQRFKDDHKGMAEFSVDWDPMPGAPGFQRHRWEFFGDHWLSLHVPEVTTGSGKVALILNGNGRSAMTGYRAVLEQQAEQKTLVCTIYKNDEALTEKERPALHVGEEYNLRFARLGNRLRVELDGEPLLETVDAGVPGMIPAFTATGCFSQAREALALGSNLLDYNFSDAATDWLTEGTWMPTTRWACSNQWSFLGGWSRGDAVLWHKMRFTGDQSFQAYMAPKMEYPRENETYWTRFRDMAVTICGDGRNPRTGYTGIHGAPDEQGNPNRRTVLMRNGVVVQSVYLPMIDAYRGDGHTNWFDLSLRKRGATVEFWVEGRRVLSYTDPQPIDGGVPAVWTNDNGVALGRVRMSFAGMPQPRHDAQVTLDDPWYPAWADQGRPLTLDFAHTRATSGKPVTLRVTPRQVPAGDETAAAVEGTRVIVTPRATGTYWYQITAGDGAATSPAFHVTLPVFNPALKRDDSHALVLYQFTEGTGQVISDHGQGAPANLIIPDGAPVEWQPNQGLSIHGPGRIMTKTGAEKLMALAKTRAATFEMWINIDTVHPPTYWLAGLLSWEQPNEQRNFAISEMWWDVLVAPRGRTFNPFTGGAIRSYHALRTGLRHLVVTWDATAGTRVYVDGNMVGNSRTPWNEATWDSTAPLILGSLAEGQPNICNENADAYNIGRWIMPNRPEMQHVFMGSFYLVAIHDRAFAPDEVRRQYQAGPSVK